MIPVFFIGIRRHRLLTMPPDSYWRICGGGPAGAAEKCETACGPRSLAESPTSGGVFLCKGCVRQPIGAPRALSSSASCSLHLGNSCKHDCSRLLRRSRDRGRGARFISAGQLPEEIGLLRCHPGRSRGAFSEIKRGASLTPRLRPGWHVKKITGGTDGLVSGLAASPGIRFS